jgi:hypothetical protein
METYLLRTLLKVESQLWYLSKINGGKVGGYFTVLVRLAVLRLCLRLHMEVYTHK